MRTSGGLRAVFSAVALGSLISACSAHGTSPVPDSATPQSTARHALVFVTPTPAPTATPVPGSPGTLAWACGGDEDCSNIRLVGLLSASFTKRLSNPKLNDAAFVGEDFHGSEFASCEGKRLWTGDRDEDFSRLSRLPFLYQTPGPVFFFADASTLANPCTQHGNDDDDHGNKHRVGPYYIAIIGFSSSGITFQALSGPAQENGTDLVFAGSQGYATMQPGAYGFFIVRNTNPDVVLPTPAPTAKGGGLGGGLTLGG